MALLWRWLRRLLLLALVPIVLLLLPVGYVELACRGDGDAVAYDPILPTDHHRPESNTYLTYPEWHIVHAYDDYAQVLRTGDPHDFGYLRSIDGFWSSLCDLSRLSASHGGFPGETKAMIYVIGTSFSAEMMLKAAYEETIGRMATWVRGPTQAPLDALSAEQARAYARFLQQVPWYEWDFTRDANALDAASSEQFRDRERRLALGLEYRAKAAYAGVIAAAVANTGAAKLSLRMVVTGDDDTDLDGVRKIADHPEGVELETIRYRALTHILVEMAGRGTEFIEIAGNDDIMITVTSDSPTFDNALTSLKRQGYGDYRHLLDLKVSDLAATLRALETGGAQIEHIHDY